MSSRVDAVLDRLDRLAGAGLTARAFQERALSEVKAIVPFDAHAWGLTDPVTRLITSPHADVPFLPWPRLPEVIRCRYLTRLNRWDVLADAATTVMTLKRATQGDLERSRLWREVWADYDVVDIATIVFVDRFGCWGFGDLMRCAPAVPFDAVEVGFLARLADTVTQGLRAGQAGTFADQTETPLVAGPAVVVLDEDLHVRVQTSAAAEALMQLLPPGSDMAPIPAAVYNIAAALVASEAGVPVGPPRSRVHLGAGQWVTLHADRIGHGDIAVTIEPSTPADRLEIFGLAHGLSPRERDVLAALVAGEDNRTMARRLALSEHTVHDHVKAVLAKSGVASRQLLISRVVGTR